MNLVNCTGFCQPGLAWFGKVATSGSVYSYAREVAHHVRIDTAWNLGAGPPEPPGNNSGSYTAGIGGRGHGNGLYDATRSGR